MRARPSALLLSVLVAGCAMRPVEEDVELGERVAASMEAEFGRYADAAVQDYVAAVAARVSRQVEQPLFEHRFAVLDQPEPNAFAAPGGWVFVSRGLLATAQSEDELAGVLGHELTHVEARHSAAAARPRVLASVLSLPGDLVGLLLPRLGALANMPIDTVAALRAARYGRGQESESDRVGVELAARAGYDPAALAGVLGRMQAVVAETSGEARATSYFDTHPPTPSRVRDVLARADELQPASRADDARDAAAYLRGLDGLVWGRNPSRGVFRDDLYLHPTLGVGVTFPAGWRQTTTTSFAGATRPDGRAGVFFSVPARTPGEASERVRAAKAKFAADGFEERSDESVVQGGFRLRIVEFRADDGRVGIQAWTRVGAAYPELLAVGDAGERDRLLATVRSLRALTEAEQRSVTVTRVRVVEAADGETLRGLCRRVVQSGSLALTAALNGLEPDAPLEGGRLVKVLREEVFP